MKNFVPAFVLLALLAGPKTLFSAEKQKQSPHRPAAAGESDNPVLKEVDFHGVPLSEVVAFLRKSLPGFQAVVVPDPQCADPNPPLPDIELKNVDLQQFLEVLKKALPQLAIEAIEGGKGSVYLFKLAAPPDDSARMGQNRMGGMGGMGGPGVRPAAPSRPEPPHLAVFRLSHLIPADQPDRAKYLNNILSLVQAALEAQGSTTNVLMKVHEATETLIFRGNLEQTEAVQQVLAALEPTKMEAERAKLRDQMAADRNRSQDDLARLHGRLAETESEYAAARKRLSEQVTEIETLKARLAARGEKSP